MTRGNRSYYDVLFDVLERLSKSGAITSDIMRDCNLNHRDAKSVVSRLVDRRMVLRDPHRDLIGASVEYHITSQGISFLSEFKVLKARLGVA